MNSLQNRTNNPKLQKKLIIFGLYFIAAGITLSGLLFILYSQMNNIRIQVINVPMPGMVLGLLIAYFGIRSILSVKKLSPEISKEDARFSWDNFKRAKNR